MLPKRPPAHVGAEMGHVKEPFPAPLTTRNLCPRYTAGSTSRQSQNPRRADFRTGRTAGTTTLALRSSESITRAASVNSNPHSNSMALSDTEQPIAGPSNSSGSIHLHSRFQRRPELERERAAKRRRTGRAGTDTPEWTSDGEEEVDQLISDNESEDAYPRAPDSTLEFEPGPPLSQLEPENTVDDIEEFEEDTGPNRSNPDAIGTITGTPVSSPSLARILHTTNVEPQPLRSPSPVVIVSFGPASTSTSTPALASTSTSSSSSSTKPPAAKSAPTPEAEHLSEYTCPICFFPPTNATLTPCGHVCCGACLFTAIRTTMQRGAVMLTEGNGARCPVCRAEIPGWDGRGGGVIGLKPRAVFSL